MLFLMNVGDFPLCLSEVRLILPQCSKRWQRLALHTCWVAYALLGGVLACRSSLSDALTVNVAACAHVCECRCVYISVAVHWGFGENSSCRLTMLSHLITLRDVCLTCRYRQVMNRRRPNYRAIVLALQARASAIVRRLPYQSSRCGLAVSPTSWCLPHSGTWTCPSTPSPLR